jgi:hypothetical protein
MLALRSSKSATAASSVVAAHGGFDALSVLPLRDTHPLSRYLTSGPPPLVAERCSHYRRLQAQASNRSVLFRDAAPPCARLEQAQFIKVASAKRPHTCARERHGVPCPIVPLDCVENSEHCEPEPNWAGDVKRSMAAPTTKESSPDTAVGVIDTWPQKCRRPSTSQRRFRCSSTCAPPSWRTTL